MNFYISVAKTCNTRCKYCYVPEYNKNNREMIDKRAVDGIRELIKKLRSSGEEIGTVTLHGAEPTTLSAEAIAKITDIVWGSMPRYSRHRIGMQTNGINCTEEYLSKLDPKKNAIGFSIDGPKVIHNKYRLDTYDTVFANMMTAYNMGFSISVLSVITKETVKYADDFFQWVTTRLPKGISVTFKFLHGDEESVLSKEEQELFIDYCIEYKCTRALQILRNNICILGGNECEWY